MSTQSKVDLPVLDRAANKPSSIETRDLPTVAVAVDRVKQPAPSRQQPLWARRLLRSATLPISVWRARQGLPQQPRVLTHTVTFGCNARCVMCDSWKLSTEEDLRLDEIESIYRQLPLMDAVRITGGEPFVRQDMLDIVKAAVRWIRPWFIHISSNGFLTDRIIDFCQQRPRSTPLELALSIDGVGDVHNRIRGNSRAWDTVWKTLSLLAPRRKEFNLTLVVNQTVVDEQGLEQYHRLAEKLRLMDIEHHLIIAYSESATYSLQRDRAIEFPTDQSLEPFADLDPNQLDGVLRVADEHARSLPWHRRLARRYYLTGVKNRLLGQNARTPNPKCQALHTHLRIFPNGDVPVCQFNSRIVGNFRNSTFQEIWQSALTGQERQWVRKCPGCWAECENLPSAVYTLDLMKVVGNHS
jgi:Fe-coproporphyrin III synthase